MATHSWSFGERSQPPPRRPGIARTTPRDAVGRPVFIRSLPARSLDRPPQRTVRPDPADPESAGRARVPCRASRPADQQGRAPRGDLAGRVPGRRRPEGVRQRDPAGARRRCPPASDHRDRPPARLPVHRRSRRLASESRADGRAFDLAAPRLPVQYARSGEVNIAYQVLGTRSRSISCSSWAGFPISSTSGTSRRSRASCGVWPDSPGSSSSTSAAPGLSDRVADLPSLEERMEDVRAVMNAAGSRRAVLLGVSEGGPMCSLFAATYPEQTEALIMIGTLRAAAARRRLSVGAHPRGTRGLLPRHPRALGRPSRPRDPRAQRRRRSRVSRVVGGLPADGSEPGGRGGAHPDERADRRPARAADDPGSDPRAAPVRRSLPARRGGPLHGEPDPGRPLRGAARRRPPALRRRPGRAPRRDRTIPDRRACARRVEPGARHDPVRHAQSERAPFAASGSEIERLQTLVAAETQRFKGRALAPSGRPCLLGLRRPGPRDSLRPLHRGRSLAPGHVARHRTAYRRMGPAPRRRRRAGGGGGRAIAALARVGDVLVSRTVVDLIAGIGIQFSDRGSQALGSRRVGATPLSRPLTESLLLPNLSPRTPSGRSSYRSVLRSRFAPVKEERQIPVTTPSSHLHSPWRWRIHPRDVLGRSGHRARGAEATTRRSSRRRCFKRPVPTAASIQSTVDAVPRRTGCGEQRQHGGAARERSPRDQLGRRRLDRDLAGAHAVHRVPEHPRGKHHDEGDGFRAGAPRRPRHHLRQSRPTRPSSRRSVPLRLFSPVGSNKTRWSSSSPAARAPRADDLRLRRGLHGRRPAERYRPGGRTGRAAQHADRVLRQVRPPALRRRRPRLAGRRRPLRSSASCSRTRGSPGCASRPVTRLRAGRNPNRDIVMMDDFLYGEPQAIQ